MSSIPSSVRSPDENAQSFPQVFSACAVARSMSQATSEVSTSVKGTVREQLAFPVPEMPLSVPRPDFVKEQGGQTPLLKICLT